jgi:hypothetical protein
LDRHDDFSTMITRPPNHLVLGTLTDVETMQVIAGQPAGYCGSFDGRVGQRS